MNVKFRLFTSMILMSSLHTQNVDLHLCSSARNKHKILCDLPLNELWSLGELCEIFLSTDEIQHDQQNFSKYIIEKLLKLPSDNEFYDLLNFALDEIVNPPNYADSLEQPNFHSRMNFPTDCLHNPHIFITEPVSDSTDEDSFGSALDVLPGKQVYHGDFVADEVIIGETIFSTFIKPDLIFDPYDSSSSTSCSRLPYRCVY